MSGDLRNATFQINDTMLRVLHTSPCYTRDIMAINPHPLIATLAARMPDLFRWCGAAARQLRRHDVAVADKGVGYAAADALTLADLSIQEILVDAIRDFGDGFLECRLEVEEETGDQEVFAKESELTIAIDPIDGTLHFRDRTSDGYGVLISLRRNDRSFYSLGFFPEQGPCGEWVEVKDNRVVHTLDDTSMPARQRLDSTVALVPGDVPRCETIWLTGYRTDRRLVAEHLAREGLTAAMSDSHGLHICTELVVGRVDGLLMSHPGVYDAPMWMHVLTALGGVACWVENGEPVDFRDSWYDATCKGYRLSGVIACARDATRLRQLVEVGRRCMVSNDAT